MYQVLNNAGNLVMAILVILLLKSINKQFTQFSNLNSKTMSLKVILQNIVSKITNFIKSILPSSKQLLDIALEVVTFLKLFVDRPEIDVFTALTKTIKDEKAIALLRIALPKIMVNLKLAIDELGKTPDEILKDGIKVIQGMDKNTKSVTLQSIWQLVSNDLTQDGIKLSDLQKIGQGYYEETK
ncbi:hypothetical protein [Pedobacter sp. NJ-S-72]